MLFQFLQHLFWCQRTFGENWRQKHLKFLIWCRDVFWDLRLYFFLHSWRWLSIHLSTCLLFVCLIIIWFVSFRSYFWIFWLIVLHSSFHRCYLSNFISFVIGDIVFRSATDWRFNWFDLLNRNVANLLHFLKLGKSLSIFFEWYDFISFG